MDLKDAAVLQKLQTRLPKSPGPDGLVKYVVVELDVARENHEAFQAGMLQLTELMFSFKRWELVFAAYPITGVVSRFLHIWKIPNEDTIIEIMREGALAVSSDRRDAAKNDLDQAFRAAYQSVQNLIIRTDHKLMTSLSYDPENVGYQTQTILIDGDGKPYLLYHRELHEKRPKVKRLTSLADPPTIRPKPEQNEEGRRLTWIRGLLNRGVTDATLGSANAKELLFNLAALRPKTIFEDLEELQQVPAEVPEEEAPDPKDLTLPPRVKHLLLAMPDGNVYELDKEQLQALAHPIPAPKMVKVKQLAEIFISDKIPLASLPNDRQEIVGDGCACNVINLNSFKQA